MHTWTKFSIVFLIACVAVALLGCSTIDKWRDKVKEPIPPVVVEPEPPPPDPVPEPEPPEEKQPPPLARVPVVLDYTKPWVLILTGDFHHGWHGRYASTGKDIPRDGIDLFRRDGVINLRLYNQRIRFTEARHGSISHMGTSDHWARTVKQANTARWTGKLEIHYNPHTLDCWMVRDKELVGHWKIQIVRMPPVRRELWLWGFDGTVTVR